MTTRQIERRTEIGPQLRRCANHYTDGPWYLVGEGRHSRAYCTYCNCWLMGVASEHDPRNVADYEAYINSPATVAALKRIEIEGAKMRVKLSPLGRRRMKIGTTYRYGW